MLVDPCEWFGLLEFFDKFERICAEDLGGSIRRVGNRYVGLVLADAVKALPAQRVG